MGCSLRVQTVHALVLKLLDALQVRQRRQVPRRVHGIRVAAQRPAVVEVRALWARGQSTWAKPSDFWLLARGHNCLAVPMGVGHLPLLFLSDGWSIRVVLAVLLAIRGYIDFLYHSRLCR